MTLRRSLPRGTYILYPPRVTLRSFVEDFRVHDVPTRHVRGSPTLISLPLSLFLFSSPSLPSFSLSLFLNRISSLDISGSPWCPRSISYPECTPTGMRRVYVLSRVASLFRLSRLRECISGTLVSRIQYYAASRHMEIIHLSCDTRCIIILFGRRYKKC